LPVSQLLLLLLSTAAQAIVAYAVAHLPITQLPITQWPCAKSGQGGIV